MAFVFHSWQVYKDTRALRKEVNQIVKSYPDEERYVLVNQTKRAMFSVVLQIAEGSNRRTNKDKVVFINRALTSLDEFMSCFDCALDDGYINEDRHKDFYNKIENVAKQLRGLEKHLDK